jgi:hypothetical protein
MSEEFHTTPDSTSAPSGSGSIGYEHRGVSNTPETTSAPSGGAEPTGSGSIEADRSTPAPTSDVSGSGSIGYDHRV